MTTTMITIDTTDLALRWLTPPVNQGQTVEVSYTGLYDGRVLERTHDRHDGEITYRVADLAEDEQQTSVGLNSIPEIEGEWQDCRVTE